jgi:hypothetical protein
MSTVICQDNMKINQSSQSFSDLLGGKWCPQKVHAQTT